MKKPVIVGLVVVVLVVAVALVPPVREGLHWQWASYEDTAASYASYLESWPEGGHAAEARAVHEERLWQEADALNVKRVYEDYLESYPDGEHAEEARDRIEDFVWRALDAAGDGGAYRYFVQQYPDGEHVQDALDRLEDIMWVDVRSDNTLKAFNDYLERYPEGRYAEKARSRRDAILSDDGLFIAAKKEGTAEALEKFLALYPGHPREADARAALVALAGADVLDLIKNGAIEAEAKGTGTLEAAVRLRGFGAMPRTVKIPAGTIFVCGDAACADLVATESTRASVEGNDWTTVSVPVAGMDRLKPAPGEGQTLSLKRQPESEELVRVVASLDRFGPAPAVCQAAVWLVTGDPRYKDLGTLVKAGSDASGQEAERLINEREAVRAFKLCADTGMDMTKKAIWLDKETMRQTMKEEWDKAKAEGEVDKFAEEIVDWLKNYGSNP